MLSGGRIRSLRTGRDVDIRGKDFRLRVDEGLIDPQVGQSQYGRDRDDWGNWFGCNHAKALWHYVLADQFIRRNPNVTGPNPRVDLVGTSTMLFLGDRTGPFTSACSATIYRDDLLGADFAGNAFSCDPARGLVHRALLSPEGVTFTARRAPDEERDKREFLASSDPWFRPTMTRTGPDGALWVVDMQRAILEHPHWLPAGWEKRVDPREGDDRGRIYRIFPSGSRPRPMPRLDRLEPPALVAALDSPNGWQRDMVQRLLVERRDTGAVPFLEKLATSSERSTCRLHALCALDGLSALRSAIVEQALADPHPGVRRHAVRLARSLLAKSPGLGDALESRLLDPDPQVRLELAYALGEWKTERAGRLLAGLVLGRRDAPYLLAAVLSSVTAENLGDVLATVLRQPGDAPTGLIENLARLAIAYADDGASARVLDVALETADGHYASWQLSTLAAMLEESERTDAPGSALAVRPQLDRAFEYARDTARSDAAPQPERLLAIRLLGRRSGDLDALGQLLVPQTPGALQAAIASRLGALDDGRVPGVLLDGWSAHAPGLRSSILDILLSRGTWVPRLLDEIESGRVPPTEVDAGRRQRLLEHDDGDVRDRATRLLGGEVDADRQRVVEMHRPVLDLRGDPGRGALVFRERCAACHELKGAGAPIGPDLAALTDTSPLSLLTAILDPNRAVEAKYVSYAALTRQGRTHAGMLSVEAGDSIMITNAEGKQEVILRRDLELLQSSGRSMMAEGLERDLDHQDLADIISFVRAEPRADSGVDR